MRKFKVWKTPTLIINGKPVTKASIEPAKQGADTLLRPYIADPSAVFNATAQDHADTLLAVLTGIIKSNKGAEKFTLGLAYPATEEEEANADIFTSVDYEMTIGEAVKVCEAAIAARPIIDEYNRQMGEFSKGLAKVGKCNLPASPAKGGKKTTARVEDYTL